MKQEISRQKINEYLFRAEMAAEYHQLQTKARKLADDLRKENETVERYADRVRRSEAKVR